MLLIRISWTKGLGISSAFALIGEAATSSATAAAHLKRAQYRIGRPHRPATASGPTRPRVRTERDPSLLRLSHSRESDSTVPAADLHRKLAGNLTPDSRWLPRAAVQVDAPMYPASALRRSRLHIPCAVSRPGTRCSGLC